MCFECTDILLCGACVVGGVGCNTVDAPLLRLEVRLTSVATTVETLKAAKDAEHEEHCFSCRSIGGKTASPPRRMTLSECSCQFTKRWGDRKRIHLPAAHSPVLGEEMREKRPVAHDFAI